MQRRDTKPTLELDELVHWFVGKARQAQGRDMDDLDELERDHGQGDTVSEPIHADTRHSLYSRSARSGFVRRRVYVINRPSPRSAPASLPQLDQRVAGRHLVDALLAPDRLQEDRTAESSAVRIVSSDLHLLYRFVVILRI